MDINKKQIGEKATKWLAEHPVLMSIISKIIHRVALVLAFFGFLGLQCSCGKTPKNPDSYEPFVSVRKKEISIGIETYEYLKPKKDLYLKLSHSMQDEHGFVESNECDSLLFTALYGAAGLPNLDILAARDQNGMWHRRPIERPCFKNGVDYGAPSTISRDMFVGLFWYLWATKDFQKSNELLEYGKKHDFIMGYGDPTRIFMTPALSGTLAEIVYRTSGNNPDYNYLMRFNPQKWPESITDYELHLSVLHILLRGEMFGGITDGMMSSLKYAYNHNPKNPLFSYAYHVYTDGDVTEAGNLLLDEALWPSNRLPMSKDRKSHWVLERDPGKDWKPDYGSNKVFTGGDLVFVAWLMGIE
jgi:hypothetical protein